LSTDDQEIPVASQAWKDEVKAMSERLAHESKRSGLIGFLGGAVVVGGLIMAALATLQANHFLTIQIAKTNELTTEVKKKTTQANEAKQQADTVETVLSATVEDLQAKSPAISATTTAALDHAFDANPNAAKLLARVYIHTHSTAQRARAKAVADALRAAGYIVPGIDVQPQSFKGTEVHYYTDDAQSVADADEIIKVVAATGIAIEKRQVAPAATDKLKSRAYGLWLASSLQ
jgi:hypothetical protein